LKIYNSGAMMKTNLMTIRILIFLSCIFMITPSTIYAGSKSDAVATLSAMIKAAQAGNWEKYIDEFYGEQHKFRSSADRDSLVSRFKNKWGSKVVPGLKEAAKVKPKLSKDGTKAIFKLKNGDFILYKNKQGQWTFHL
jgi:hypothetical protein